MKSFSLPTLSFGTGTVSALLLIFIYSGAYFSGSLDFIFLLAGENKTKLLLLFCVSVGNFTNVHNMQQLMASDDKLLIPRGALE